MQTIRCECPFCRNVVNVDIKTFNNLQLYALLIKRQVVEVLGSEKKEPEQSKQIE